MRKNVMLSLLAVTSVSMGAYANADLSSFIPTANSDLSKWTSATTGIKLESGLFTATDKTVTLSQTIKKLLPGSYQLTTTTSDNVTITIKSADGTEGKDGKITISSQQDVEIKAVSKDGTNGFKVGGFTLTLIFDFATTANNLAYNLTQVLNTNKDGAKDAKLNDEGALIMADINTIKDSGPDYSGDKSYAAYQKFQLYPGGTSTIQPRIDALSAKVNNNNAYQVALVAITEMKTALVAAKSNLDAATDYAKGKYKQAYDAINTTITNFSTTADAAFAGGTAGTLTTTDTKSSVLASIRTLNTNITTANQNDVDYNIVAAQIATVRATYTNTVLPNLVSVLTGVYSDKLAAAQAELKPVLDAIAAVEAKNGSPQTEKNPNSHDGATANKDQNLTDLQTASSKITGINERYTTEAAGFKASYAIATGELATLKAKLAAVDITGVTTVTSDIPTINGNISTLSAKIETANATHSITALLTNTDYIALKNTITTGITTLTDKVNNFNANAATTTTLTALQNKLNSAKDAVKVLKSTIGAYTVGTKYAVTENTLQSTITGYVNGAKVAYKDGAANGTAVDYGTTHSINFTATGADIDSYLAKAKAGVAAYNQIVDSIAGYNAELTKLTRTAKIPEVSTKDHSTYAAKISDISTAIAGFSSALATALDKNDAEHYNALIALQGTIVTNFYTDVDNLCKAYSAQETIYKAEANTATATTMKSDATTRVQTLASELADLPVTYTPAKLGVSNTNFTNKLSALIQRVGDQQAKISNTAPATDAIGTIATISDVNTELTNITKEENDLKSYGDAAIANVNQKNTADGIINDLTTKAGNISTGIDLSKQVAFGTLKTNQSARLTAAVAIITASYNAETLVADWTKINARLTAIGVTTDSINTAVTAANTNYGEKNLQETAVTNAGFTGLISTATNDINSVTSGVGATYYINTVLAGYQAQANVISTDITSYYNAGTSSQYTSKITDRINTLKTSINGVKALAQANDAAYQAQLVIRQGIQKYCGDVYYDISTKDKSTKVNEYLDSLVVLQANLNALNTSVDDTFGKGQSVAQDAAIKSGYTAINASIKDVNDRRNAGYNAAIAADNLDKYTSIKGIVSATQGIYNDAVTTINKYSTIQNADIAAIVASNKEIYTYAALITSLSSSIDASYKNTASPTLFDISVFKATATTYQTNINDILAAFRTSAKNAAIHSFTAADEVANGKLDAAKNTLTGLGYATAVVNNAFSDVKTMIGNAEDKARNNSDFALYLDAILADYATIATKLAAGYEPAANAQWTYYKGVLDGQITNWKASDGYKLADYKSQIDAKIKLITDQYTAVTTDISSSTLYANLNAIMAVLEGIKIDVQGADGNHGLVQTANDAYQALQNNTAAQTDMNTAIAGVQAALNSVKSYAASYCSSDQLASTISCSQRSINALTTTANDIANASTNKTTVLNACTSLTTSINSIYGSANNIEISVLTGKIDVLKQDFNQALAALNVSASDSRVAPYWTTIGNYTTNLGTISNNYIAANTVAKQQALRLSLVNLEQSIATTHTDLVKIYDATLISSTFASLNAAIGSVEKSYKDEVNYLAGCDAKVKAEYSLDGIGAAITAAKDSISHRNAAGMLLFYSDNISGYISSISTNLSTVTTAIGAMQDIITANNTAYTLLKGQIGEINTRLASVTSVINGYKYSYPYVLTHINNDIRDAKDDVDARNLAGTLTSASTLLYKDRINTAIDNLEKEEAYYEATHLISDLSIAKNATLSILTSHADANVYTARIWDGLSNRFGAIESSITALSTYDSQAYAGIISQDIDGNAILDANNLPTTRTDFKFIDVYNKEIVAKITALNDEIATLSSDADYTLGDVTNDGSVLVDDYNTIKGYVLAPTTAPTSGRAFNTADVNKDGNINIGDVTAVANIIINRGSAASARAMRVAAVASTDAITLSSASEGTTQRIAINLKNSVAYVACQMDIKLPAGMTLVGESLSGRANGHTLNSNDLSDGSHRVVISTVENNNFNDSESAILYLDVNTANSSDIDKVSVSNIMFTDANARVYNFADLTSGSATGINGVKADQGIGSKIYSVGGKLLNTLQKGINIIRNADGSTKKIINK